MDTVQVDTKTRVMNELSALQGRLSPQEQHLLAGMLLFAGCQGAGEDEVEGHMLPTPSTFDLAQRHQAELLREAAHIHEVIEAEVGKTSVWTRMKIGLGEYLVAAGRKLENRPVVKRSHAATD